MDVTIKPKPYSKIRAVMLMFLICNTQIGIGIFGFQRYIFREANHDAWISVIIAGLFCHASVWVIVRLLRRYESTDIYGIHQDVFGRWVGGALSMLLMLFYVLVTVTIVRTYIEAIQSWIFPEFPAWLLSLLLLLLAWYGGASGLRVIAGVSIIGFVIIFSFAFLYYYPLEYAQWSRLLPIGEATPYQLWKGTLAMGLTLSGFEIVTFFYPYIKNKQHIQRFAQISVLLTNLLSLFVMIVAIIFFSPGQLLRSIWSSVNMLKIVKYPFLERMELVAMSVWIFAVVPGIIIVSWIVCRGMVRLFGFQHNKVLIVYSVIIYVCSLLFNNRMQIDKLNNFIGKISIGVSFLYPVFLYAAVIIVWWWRQRQGKKGAT